MSLLFFLIVHVAFGVAAYQQNDYKIDYERMEIVHCNPKYIKDAKTANFKYNRTAAACNYSATFKVDFGNDVMIHVQAYRLASNEYRLFPIVFEFNFCGALAKNDYGLQRFYDCGDFKKCPLTKGTYRFCNFIPDESKFPPHIPDGNYRIDLKFTYTSIDIQHMQFFGTVKRPLKIPS